MTQVYRGLDVLGTVVEAEFKQDGEPSGQAYGVVAAGIGQDIPDVDDCMRDIQKMINIAITSEGFSPDDSRIEDKDGSRYVYIDPNTQKASLIYLVEFFFAEPGSVIYPSYYIDACEERVMFSFNKVQNASIPGGNEMYFPKKRQAEEEDRCETDAPATTPRATTSNPNSCSPSAAGVGGNPKRGRIEYNSNGRCLNVRKVGDTCTMVNDFATVVDNGGSTSRTINTPVSFNCAEGFSDPVNGAYGVANDALYFGDITGRLYVEKYGVRALPYSPKLKVHYDSCYDNAFWDGTNMYFGDGCNYFYPLVSQDVVSHELGHGITTRNSNLQYRSQSGGINEAFSDMSGEVAEIFNFEENDWKVGFTIFKSSSLALRYFINPPDDGRSIKHVDQYREGLDVHYSSGVFNHAFYHLVESEGLNIYDAYQCFLSANLGIWGATTNFQDGACGVMQACYDHGIDHNAVVGAFAVVGIDLADCDFDALTTVMDTGESRMGIEVSLTRNPIIKVDLGDDKKSQVVARTQGGEEINISVTSDSGGENEFASGVGSVMISGEATFAFVKLSTTSTEKLLVRLDNYDQVES